jgi:hypothetical protein
MGVMEALSSICGMVIYDEMACTWMLRLSGVLLHLISSLPRRRECLR